MGHSRRGVTKLRAFDNGGKLTNGVNGFLRGAGHFTVELGKRKLIAMGFAREDFEYQLSGAN
jgi:hypothetical protein